MTICLKLLSLLLVVLVGWLHLSTIRRNTALETLKLSPLSRRKRFQVLKKESHT